MSDYEPGIYIDLLGDGSLIVDQASGEIVEQQGGDRLAVLAQRRHDAKQQIKGWEEQLGHYDRVLLAAGASGVFGGIVINQRQRPYSETNAESFAAYVAAEELTQAEIEAVVTAAKGFKRDQLPAAVLPFFDRVTQKKQTKPWIESAVVRQVAPKVAVVERPDDELETALAQSIADARAARTGG